MIVSKAKIEGFFYEKNSGRTLLLRFVCTLCYCTTICSSSFSYLAEKKIESTIEVIVCTLTSIHSEDKKYISDPVQSQARIFIMCFALFCIVIEINTVISDPYVGTCIVLAQIF